MVLISPISANAALRLSSSMCHERLPMYTACEREEILPGFGGSGFFSRPSRLLSPRLVRRRRHFERRRFVLPIRAPPPPPPPRPRREFGAHCTRRRRRRRRRRFPSFIFIFLAFFARFFANFLASTSSSSSSSLLLDFFRPIPSTTTTT